MYSNDYSLEQVSENRARSHREENAGQNVSFYIVCAIVLCSPSDYVVIGNSGGGATVFFTEALIWPFTFCIVAYEAITFRANTLQQGFNAVPMSFLYIGICFLSTMMALGLNGSGDTIGKFKNLLPGFLLLNVIVSFVRSQKQINIILILVLLGIIANAILSIVQFKTGDYYFVTPLKGNEYKADPFGQILRNTGNGFFSTANNLGAVLMPGIIFSVYFLCRMLVSRSATKVSIWLVATTLIGWGLILSYNKGAIIWSFIGIVVSIIRLRRKFLIVVASIILGIAAFAFYGSLGQAEAGSVALNTLTVRIQIWKATFKVLEDWPSVLWYGDGLKYMSYWNATIAGWSFPSAHNTWLDQILIFGIPGIVLYTLLWVSIIVMITDCVANSDGVPFNISNCLTGCVAAVAGESFFEPRADNATPVIQLFLMFALVACQSRVITNGPCEGTAR